jgi:hypothetical protein
MTEEITETTPTRVAAERRRPVLLERLEELENLLVRLDAPGGMERREFEALQKTWSVGSRTQLRGRLRTEHLRIRNYLEDFTKEGATHG